jgi:hypothetical protein
MAKYGRLGPYADILFTFCSHTLNCLRVLITNDVLGTLVISNIQMNNQNPVALSQYSPSHQELKSKRGHVGFLTSPFLELQIKLIRPPDLFSSCSDPHFSSFILHSLIHSAFFLEH